MNCGIIQDLLPLYHDGVCSPESRTEVEEHLKTCPDCRAALAVMDAPLPEVEKAAADDAAAMKKISGAWKKDKRRAWWKGALIAAAVCAVLVGLWAAATQLYVFPVDPEKIEITDVRQLSDGRILYHFYIDDDLNLRLLQFEFEETDGTGNMYFVPKRSLYTEKRQRPSLADSDQYLNLEEASAWARVHEMDAEITRVWYGRGEDAVLLWEEGMALPAASAADEAEWSYSESSAAYWAEHYGALETDSQE